MTLEERRAERPCLLEKLRVRGLHRRNLEHHRQRRDESPHDASSSANSRAGASFGSLPS